MSQKGFSCASCFRVVLMSFHSLVSPLNPILPQTDTHFLLLLLLRFCLYKFGAAVDLKLSVCLAGLFHKGIHEISVFLNLSQETLCVKGNKNGELPRGDWHAAHLSLFSSVCFGFLCLFFKIFSDFVECPPIIEHLVPWTTYEQTGFFYHFMLL